MLDNIGRKLSDCASLITEHKWRPVNRFSGVFEMIFPLN